MKAKKRFAVRAAFALFIVAVLALSFGFMACGDKEPGPGEEAKLESISLDTSNVQTTFDYGDEFTYAGLVVTAHMSDGTTQPVDLDDCRVTTPDLTNPGTRVVNVVYSGKSARYSITVRERVMPPISDKAMIEIPADAATVYRVEAEDIDLESTLCVHSKGEGEFVEVPAAMGGKLVEIGAKQGSKINKGDVVAYIERAHE